MSAENLLYLLDECDELNVLLHESLRPGMLVPFGLLAVATTVGLHTGSIALGAVTLIAAAWSGLLAAWGVESLSSNSGK
ncbi:MAG: hypothetical protein AB8G17_21300 [Gammaproteobacteria bacterium]